jgi:hypothetical protein
LRSNNFNAWGERRPSSVGDEGGQADGVGSPGFVTRPGTSDAAVIFDADKQPGGSVRGAIRQADHRLDQIVIGQRAMLIALELHVERLPSGDQFLKAFRSHRGFSQ